MHMLTICETYEKLNQGETPPDQSYTRTLLEWMSVFLNSREIRNSLFTMRSSKTKFRSCESYTFSMHLIFSHPFSYFISLFFAHNLLICLEYWIVLLSLRFLCWKVVFLFKRFRICIWYLEAFCARFINMLLFNFSEIGSIWGCSDSFIAWCLVVG